MARDEQHAELMSALEALLFVSDEPVGAARLASILEVTPSAADEALMLLKAEYEEENRGMQLREVAGGWRFFTHPAFHEVIERYVISWDSKRLSAAALEALAVVAYHQPVTRAGINAIRGVNSEAVISSLIEKGLVREMGRDNAPGNAILYGTTRTFLEKFGLRNIGDLPELEAFAADEQSREYIRERLSSNRKTEMLPLEEPAEPADEEEPELAAILAEALTDKVDEF